MTLPSTTEELLALLDRNGWSTSAFRRHFELALWPTELRLQYFEPLSQQHQQHLPRGQQSLLLPPQQQQVPTHLPAASPLLTTAAAAASTRIEASSVRICDLVAREAAVAYGKIRQHVRQTPLEPSPWLSSLAVSGSSQQHCTTVLLKLESEQHTGSFKVRGALTKLLSLRSEALSRGVFTASTGNHALAVLYACAALSSEAAATSSGATLVSTIAAAAGDGDVLATAGASTTRQPLAAAVAVAAGAGTKQQPLPPQLPEPQPLQHRQQSVLQGEQPTAAAASDAAAGSGAAGGSGGAGVNKRLWLLRPQLYVPTTASLFKIRKLKSLGAELHLYGTDCLESELAARAAATAAGAVYISPYNDPWVMAGQGTIGLELLAARRRGHLDVVLVPVGGGGLIGGVASVLKAADPSIQVIGCQPAASDVMARSVAAGRIVPEVEVKNGGDDADGGESGWSTLSDATAGGVEYGSITLQPCMDCVDEWVTVSEAEIADALIGLLEEQSKLVEGAAACALAVFKRLAPRLAGKTVVLVCCGGNISLPTLRRAMDMARPPEAPAATATVDMRTTAGAAAAAEQ